MLIYEQGRVNRCNKKPIAGIMTLHLTNQRANCDFEQANCDFERANCDFWNITFAIAGEKGATDRFSSKICESKI